MNSVSESKGLIKRVLFYLRFSFTWKQVLPLNLKHWLGQKPAIWGKLYEEKSICCFDILKAF